MEWKEESPVKIIVGRGKEVVNATEFATIEDFYQYPNFIQTQWRMDKEKNADKYKEMENARQIIQSHALYLAAEILDRELEKGVQMEMILKDYNCCQRLIDYLTKVETKLKK